MQSQFQLVIGGQTKRSTTGQHPVDVDWNALPDNAQEFIVKYGLKQYLADSMAGASSAADAAAKVAARFAKLVSGDGFDRPDTTDSRAMKLARAAIRDALKAANKTADKEAITDAAKKMVETQPKWRKEAEKQLAAEAAAKEALAADESNDILADLLGGDQPAFVVMSGGTSTERAFGSNWTGDDEDEANEEAERRNAAEREAGRDEDAVLWYVMPWGETIDALKK